MFDPELAQPGDPLQDRLGIEAELGDDVDRHAGRFRRLDLVRERTVEVLLRYARMAVGIGGDGDPRDAVTLQRAAVDHLDGAAEVAGGLVVIARDHQHARHPRLAPEAGEKIIKLARGRKAAHGKVRHRLEAGLAQPRRGVDRLVHGSSRHRADIDAGAGWSDVGQSGDVVGGRPRRFEREAGREIGDCFDRIGAILDGSHDASHVFHSRRREIT